MIGEFRQRQLTPLRSLNKGACMKVLNRVQGFHSRSRQLASYFMRGVL